MLLRAGGGGGNRSTPPAGWTRAAPNLVYAKPQVVVVPFYNGGTPDNIVRNQSFATALGAATGLAKFLILRLDLTIVSTGVAGNYSNIHGASYYDNGITELDFCDGGQYQWAIVAAGTLIANPGVELIQPVDNLGRGWCKYNDGVAGASGNTVSCTIIGYYD